MNNKAQSGMIFIAVIALLAVGYYLIHSSTNNPSSDDTTKLPAMSLAPPINLSKALGGGGGGGGSSGGGTTPTPSTSEWCYQESTNTTNQTGLDNCDGLNYTGLWSFTVMPMWNQSGDPANDGNWSSYDYAITALPFAEGYIQYYKPDHALSDSLWQVKGLSGVYNITIPEGCWDYAADYLAFFVYSEDNTINGTYYFCMNATDYPLIYADAGPTPDYGYFYDEAMQWHINTTEGAEDNPLPETYTCEQETSNASKYTDGTCELNYSGTYSWDYPALWNWTDPEDIFDGSILTYGINPNDETTANLFVNYTPPTGYMTTSQWAVSDGTFDVPPWTAVDIDTDCWDETTATGYLQFRVSSTTSTTLGNRTEWACYGASSWHNLQVSTGSEVANRVIEEWMIWEINSTLG